MDIEDIRQIEKVVDRLAAIGPSGVRPPHCWFCGKLDAWFLCDCRDARDAQAGKRAKPRVEMRAGKTVIVLEPEVMAREHNRVWARYAPPANASPVSIKEPSVSTGPANAAPSDRPVSTDRSEARKAYQRELMRKRRAVQSGKQEP